ncbi:RlpA-like double-psi beta-barrel-protein domain-containing protein-containing protein [Lentinula aciculospora]|uniref:RlpA-like double-psi beta-barrel-protein domain-containing protein-containing protein n=1 Tax=Lentinula aciculospora TaxID=153920 RepID=A0A9W9AM38_9AGAR|nr:RlpA-like double-psi beta-barrel-protein domain-containing protein-containing protein [Lentinula aciculospora]
MHSFSYLSLLSVTISLFFSATQASTGHGKLRVSHLSRNISPASISKRDPTTGAFTYYVAGLGACGTTNTANDFIVALNSDQWDGGSHCYEMVTLSYGGKTVTAQVTDQCPTCAYGQLDLTYSLFASLSGGDPNQIGEMQGGTWSFADDSSSTSSTSQYTPSSTMQTPTSTSTSTPPPSTTSSSSSTLSTSSWTSTFSSSSSITTTSSTSSSASASPTTSTGPQVLAQLQLAVIQLGGLTSNAYMGN